MKKSLIATGAASLALAAMPVVGVFAVPAQVVDNLTVTIDPSCTFEATQGTSTIKPDTNNKIQRNFAGSGTLGGVVYLGGATNAGADGTPITVAATCNSSTGTGSSTPTWTINVVSDEALTGAGSNAISGTTAGNEALESGAASGWSMRIVAPEDGVTSGWKTWHLMPGNTATNIVTGTASVSEDTTFTPEYRVYIGTDQAADTYTGTVTYSIVPNYN